MKRSLVALLVVLAVVVLVSPGIVGRMAEKNLEENLEWAESESPGVEVTTESFDRGWFTSEGRHRVVLNSGNFRQVAEAYAQQTGFDEPPALIIDTRIDHGLVPVTSLARDSGTLMPGLGSTISTFQVDPGNGELVPLPGTLYSDVSLGGATSARYLLGEGSYTHEDVRVEWQGSDVSVDFDSGAGTIDVDGTVDPFTISDDLETVHFGTIATQAKQVRSEFGFNVGTAEFSIDSIRSESAAAPTTIGKLAVSLDSEIVDERLNFTTKMSIDQIEVTGMGEMDMTLDMTYERLDAMAVQRIAEIVQEAQESPDPEIAMMNLMADIQADLQQLVEAGAEVRIDQLDITLPQGKVESKITIDIPEDDSGSGFSWASVLLKMTATADIRVPAALMDYAEAMNPQAGAMVAMGFLKPDGDDYVMQAEYAQGLLNVNGAPMPIPMPQ